MILSRLIVMLTLTSLLTACGQRGPLFLPEETQPPVAGQQTEDPLEADLENEDKVHGGGFEAEQTDES